MKENMNARCYCGHRLSQHKSSGDCCMCGCEQFTEKVGYHCPVCKGPILIRYAPNDDVERLRYKDDGSNYVHVKCKDKMPKSPFKRPEPRWLPPTPRQAKQIQTDAVAMVFSREKLDHLISILSSHGFYQPDGEPDPDVVKLIEDSALLRELAVNGGLIEGDDAEDDPDLWI